ncbi:hypothetical protein BH10ACT9_BH10ACT9_15180 [soil metagenome]
MTQCNQTLDRIAGELGDFTCQNAPAVVHLRNPLALSNWTLPVLELMMVAGAVFALWWAVRRLRRDGDPINLVLWCATVIYLFVVEIPLYFPDIFGVEESLGVVFSHNVFTVQFLFDRLPLYIVALYPAVTTLSYEIVRVLGVFTRRGGLVGALCVGFVHHCFYEVFDQLGPQLRWWAWNTDNQLNHPMLASVPMTSVFIFAVLGPVVCTALVWWFVGRKAVHGPTFSVLGLSWRTLVIGALVPVGLAVLSIPSSLFGGEHANVTAQAIVFGVQLVLLAAIAIPVLATQWRHLRHRGGADESNEFVLVFGPVYLGVLLVLWLAALPAYFGATDGVTVDGTPVGSLGYAALSFVAAALCVAAAVSVRASSAPRIYSDVLL